MNAIDRYIAELSSRLSVGRHDRARIVAEVRDHLDDAAECRERAGVGGESAAEAAVEDFGAAPELASQFNAEAGTRAMRRAPVLAVAAGIAVFSGLLIAGRAQPRPAVPLHAMLATQVSFFVAALAFQIAVVAGVCAASRALAMHRLPIAGGDDRQFVHRAVVITTAALGVAAAAWATTLALAIDRLAHPDIAAAVSGAALMIGAATLAIVTTQHLRANAADHTTDAPIASTGIFAVGELSATWVRRHPVVSCAVIAALSVLPAMLHAETTFVGALPWGIAQAATVVIAFVVVGPPLGLRERRRARTQ